MVDAFDEAQLERHADMVAEFSGGIDVVFNGVEVCPVQGIPFTNISLEDFVAPITAWTSTQFLTSRAAPAT